jgi:hypothetical protein
MQVHHPKLSRPRQPIEPAWAGKMAGLADAGQQSPLQQPRTSVATPEARPAEGNNRANVQRRQQHLPRRPRQTTAAHGHALSHQTRSTATTRERCAPPPAASTRLQISRGSLLLASDQPQHASCRPRSSPAGPARCAASPPCCWPMHPDIWPPDSASVTAVSGRRFPRSGRVP